MDADEKAWFGLLYLLVIGLVAMMVIAAIGEVCK